MPRNRVRAARDILGGEPGEGEGEEGGMRPLQKVARTALGPADPVF